MTDPGARDDSFAMESLAPHFSEEELAEALFYIYPDRADAREIARTLKIPYGNPSFSGPDEILFALMSAISDDAAIRVGRVRGQSPEEAIAWRDRFFAENGHPRDWRLERDDEPDLPQDN
jgi:hypothetical protein